MKINGADKTEMAKTLARAYKQADPTISRIVRVLADPEQEATEPVKLLEVNPETSASGIIPVSLGAAPPEFPFPSVVIEVTENEFDAIREGKLPLPEGWRLDETLYPVPA
jgi:hypothetical protein